MEEEEDKEAQKTQTPGASWWSGWGQEWIDSIKEKSASTLEMVKKDLHEFVDVIQGDTSVAISETATKIEETVKKEEIQHDSAKKVLKKGAEGFSKFLHSVSELMAIEPDDTQEELITLTDDKFPAGYDRKQAKLHAIQTDPGTYCNEPEGLFNDWLDVFALDDHKTEMSDLLVQNPAVRAIYTQLVPNVVSHTIFWQRYFYQIFLMETEEKRREELLARANDPNDKDEMDGGWSDEEDKEEIKVVIPSTEIYNSTATAPANTEVIGSKKSVESKSTRITEMAEENFPPKPTDFSLQTAIPNTVAGPIKTESHLNVAETSSTQNDNMTEKTASVVDISNDAVLSYGVAVETKTLDKSCDTIVIAGESDQEDVPNENSSPSVDKQTKETSAPRLLPLLQEPDTKHEHSETSSLNSWISIDDDMKVKKVKGEQEIKNDSESKSSHDSSEVLVNKSDADGLDEDDDDFDLEIDDDVNDEELAKMVQEIKNKSASGVPQDDDDDDWENWE